MLPAIWVGLNVALAGWGIMGSWRTTVDYEMPDGVLYLVYAGLVAGIVNILWGLYLIGLAVNRSDRFPRQFTVWQVANILWIVGREAYVLVTPDFVPTIQSLLFAAGQIAIGVVCILLLRRTSGTARTDSSSGSQRPSRHRLDHRRLPRRRRRRCARFRRRPARRQSDRRGHRHELLRGRLRLFCFFHRAVRHAGGRGRRRGLRGLARKSPPQASRGVKAPRFQFRVWRLRNPGARHI